MLMVIRKAEENWPEVIYVHSNLYYQWHWLFTQSLLYAIYQHVQKFFQDLVIKMTLPEFDNSPTLLFLATNYFLILLYNI